MNRSQSARYTIRQVIDLTGVSEFTLRGWETRYKAIEPSRNTTGRRFYSQTDILKVKLLLNLTALGHRIGKIADLSVSELERMKTQYSPAAPSEGQIPPSTQKLIQKIAENVIRFEWNEVERIFVKEMKSKKTEAYIDEFLLPLITVMNTKVDAGLFSIAQEHILSALIKKSLNSLISLEKSKHKKNLRLVFATPEGDFHEIGLLIAAALANSKGAQILYLGPNVPAADLCETCLRYKATHALVTSTVSKKHGAKDDYLQFINFLDRQLDPNVHLLLAGRNANLHSINLQRKHSTFKSFTEYESIF